MVTIIGQHTETTYCWEMDVNWLAASWWNGIRHSSQTEADLVPLEHWIRGLLESQGDGGMEKWTHVFILCCPSLVMDHSPLGKSLI